MKKKVIIIVIAIVLVVALVIGGIVFIPKIMNNGSDTDSSNGEQIQIPELGNGKEFFKITAIEEIEPLVEKYGFKLEGPEYDAGLISVYDATCCDLPVQFEFIPYDDETQDLLNMSCYYIPFSFEYEASETPEFTHNGKELREEVNKFFDMLEKVYSVTIDDNYFVISSADGTLLPNTDDATYNKIISKEAFIDFSLRDERGFYWNLRSTSTEEGLIYLKFTNYYDSIQYAENIAHVTVE